MSENEERIPKVLADFFDAETAEQKLRVLEENADSIDERTMGNIEASLDLAGKDGPIEQRLDFVMYYLRTRSRFETTRLR